MSTLTKILRLNQLKTVFFNTVRCSSTQSNLTKSPITGLSSIANPWIWRENHTNFRLPQVNRYDISLPSGMFWSPFINEPEKVAIEEPPNSDTDNTKQAARLIVIRRKKMKKHKLRKLRKRMKFEWAKLRQKRELRKEKLFQAELIEKCKMAEAFSAEQYVNERLAKYNEIIIPKTWKGRRLPEFLIREKMGLPPKE